MGWRRWGLLLVVLVGATPVMRSAAHSGYGGSAHCTGAYSHAEGSGWGDAFTSFTNTGDPYAVCDYIYAKMHWRHTNGNYYTSINYAYPGAYPYSASDDRFAEVYISASTFNGCSATEHCWKQGLLNCKGWFEC